MRNQSGFMAFVTSITTRTVHLAEVYLLILQSAIC